MPRTSSRPPRARALARTARHLTAFTAAAVLCALAAPAEVAAAASPGPSASTAPKLPAGLYGSADPTYDGVFRQATAVLALNVLGAVPPAQAVKWLTGQICADGGFEAYRADPGTACVPRTEDTNSTGMAVQALARLGGHQALVTRAATWLKGMQNDDGGWGYQRGAASDADSTAVVAGALHAAHTDPAGLSKQGRTPLTALLALQLGCKAKAGERGAFAYQPDPKSGKLAANAKATTDGILGARSATYAVAAPPLQSKRSPAPLKCASGKGGPTDAAASAEAGSAYLAGVLAAGGQHLTTAEPGSATKVTDFGTTADAVLALASDGDRAAAVKPYVWLEKHGAYAWAKNSPAGLGSLILDAAAVDGNPHDFAGADLVYQLSTLGPQLDDATAPATVSAPSGDGGGINYWWPIGAVLVVAIAIALVYIPRAKHKKQS